MSDDNSKSSPGGLTGSDSTTHLNHRSVRRRDLARLAGAGRSPMQILQEQNSTRLAELIPLRTTRMSASPFTFFRGTAAIMAADQAQDPHSGILVASCGDSHLSNFGFYASPQRTLMFDLNDFDEAAWAPWEWDLKRLVTSVIIGGRATDRDDATVERAARGTVNAYISTLRNAVERSPLERYYSHFDPAAVHEELDKASAKALRRAIKDAEKRTGERATRRLTEESDAGGRQFIENPPVMTHIDAGLKSRVHGLFEQYLASAYVDVRMLLAQYSVEDVVRRVVGVGSVGTRCYVVLLREPAGSSLILQVKEAGPSVLERYGGIQQPSAYRESVERGGQGIRVVGLQRILQAYSDPFLGHLRSPAGDFYVRQFHDKKGSVDVEELADTAFRRYSAACGVVLARAHSQSRTASEVVEYIGTGRRVAKSVVAWSEAYAQRSLGDYNDFVTSFRNDEMETRP